MEDDGDVEITGGSGVNALRDMPHPRHDCVVHKWPQGPPAQNKDACKQFCAKCFCFVCDIEASRCEHWDQHCLADGSVEWLKKRQQRQRTEEARRKGAQAGYVPRPADEMRRSFAEAANEENRQQDMSQDEEAAAQVREQAAVEDEDAEDMFTATYEPFHFKRGQPHPDPVVETTSLSFAEPPPIKYDLNLPDGIFEPRDELDNPAGGALSNLQLETVAYACQRHESIMANGCRAGFFLGDGVGLGKGRQLAGVIVENWLCGRKRHLWVSVSADLMEDAKRDLKDIGFSHIEVKNITKLDYGKLDKKGPKGIREGVVFATYSALVSSQRGGKTRAAQIAEWLGGAQAEGCILFDESHKAKNLAPEKNEKGKPTTKKSSKMALTCQKLQADCPRSRVVYCSATGASSLQNMAYMERLGLWGAHTAFPDFNAFDKAIGGGGVGAMELIALDLKRRGMYLCRQLSFSAASFDTKMVDLTPRQEKMYDEAAAFWSELLCAFNYAVHEVLNLKEVKGPPNPTTGKPKPHPSSRVIGHYWGCHQRFFRSLCMAMKVPELVKMAKGALADNKCVVVGLQTTGEARLNDAVKSGEDLEEFAGMKECVRFLLKKFPTGDYTNQHPESDLDDGDESDDDDLTREVAGATSRVNAGKVARAAVKRSGRLANGGRGSDEEGSDDEDDDLDGFIVRDGQEEESEDEDYEATDDEEGDGEQVRLPAACKKMPAGQLRQLLRAAKVNDQQCTGRAKLVEQLKQVERQARSSGGQRVADLLAKAGLGGSKRPSPDSAQASGRPKRRLQRGAEKKSYIELSSEEEEEEEDVEMGEAETGDYFVGKELSIEQEGGGRRVATVVAHYPSTGHHRVRYADGGGGAEDRVLLKEVKWDYHRKQAAPGASGARRAVQDSDSEDLLEAACSGASENAPPQRSSKGKARKSAGKARRVAADDSDASWSGGSGDEDEEEVARPTNRASRSKSPLPAPTKSAAKPKPKRRMSYGSDDDLLSESEEEEEDLSWAQHSNPAEIKMLQRLKKQLVRKLNALKMPDNPLDKLIEELGGAESVAELTGRKGRLVRDEEGRTVYQKRNANEVDSDTGRMVAMERINLAEKKAFMDGRKLVAIISEAASSGISLQADRRVPNTRKRLHITLELPWSADQCIQQCGRTHRSNQIHGPEYQLFMTACGGERRFASTVAKRLQQLGAITKGDRRAADASDLSMFDVDTKWGKKAYDELIELLSNPLFSSTRPPPPYVRRALGLKANDELHARWKEYLDDAEEAVASVGINTDDKGSVKGFLNRLLGMCVKMQNKVFDHFMAILEEKVRVAKQNGEFDDGVVDIRGESVKVAANFPREMKKDPISGVPLLHFKLDVDRGLSFKRAMEMLDEKAKSNETGKLYPREGFYVSKRPLIGREKEGPNGVKALAFLIQRPMSAFAVPSTYIHTYGIHRPNTGLGATDSFESFTEGITPRFSKLTPEAAKDKWEALYRDGLRMCSHGPNCKHGSRCTVGKRVQQQHLICGAVIPFWAVIKEHLEYQKKGGRDGSLQMVKVMRIVRVRCVGADGREQRLVGVEISDKGVAKLDAALNNQPAPQDVKPDVKPDLHQLGRGGASSSSSHGGGASSSDVKPDVRGLRVGAHVMVHGLATDAGKKLNGKSGKIERWDAAMQPSGRWIVRINGQQGTNALQAKNLAL